MGGDDGEDTEISSVIIPVSMIREIAFEIIHAVDAWHEARGLEDMDMRKCVVAIMASAQAAIDMIAEYPDGETLQ